MPDPGSALLVLTYIQDRHAVPEFYRDLISLIYRADFEQRNNLARAYPGLVLSVILWQEGRTEVLRGTAAAAGG